MSVRNESSRSGWLAVLSDRRSRIANLLGEIASLGAPAAMKPSIFKKFLELLSQVAYEKDREEELIERIEAVEEQHRYCRAHSRLEQADPTYVAKAQEEHGKEMPGQRKGLWQCLRMWLSPEGTGIAHTEQGLKND